MDKTFVYKLPSLNWGGGEVIKPWVCYANISVTYYWTWQEAMDEACRIERNRGWE